MNQEVLEHSHIILDEKDMLDISGTPWSSYIPFTLAILGSFTLLLIRVNIGGGHFITDGALMILALASYLIAAVFYLLNFYAPFRFAEQLGLWAATLGVFFNFSSWLCRWAAAFDREYAIFTSQGAGTADMPWIFRYVPFANLYDLSLAFAFGAGVTTLLVMRRPHFRIIAALSLPLAAIILVLARFIGNEFIDLPPVLDSYWRPIHVGIASMSYGIALVTFAVAVLYLLKDGLKVEKMAFWTSAFAIAVFATIGKFGVFSPMSFGTYTASTFVGNSRMALALRADIPYVGWLLVLATALLIGACVAFGSYLSQSDEKMRLFGKRLLIGALVVQALGIGMLVYQIRATQNVAAIIGTGQYERFAVWMLQQQDTPQEQINQ
ncbi:MAG: cytochrome c biogenesis protein CcsA, partial [Acidobacteriota bacterium]